MQPPVPQEQLQLSLMTEPELPQELQPQLLQPQELQPQPFVFCPATEPLAQQGLQQELATKSGKTMPCSEQDEQPLRVVTKRLQELQAIRSPPREKYRGGICLHDILCQPSPLCHSHS